MAGKARSKAAPVAASQLPVARVLVDNPLPHLNRPFDYLVPEAMDAIAQPGVRVRVRFAGRLVSGYIAERVEDSDYPGRLGFLDAVVSAEQVLTPQVLRLARAVANRYAGTLADVLRLAVPPRHARVEAAMTQMSSAQLQRPGAPGGPGAPDGLATAQERGEIDGLPAPENYTVAPLIQAATSQTETVTSDSPGWAQYDTGTALLRALGRGLPARAVWQIAPAEDWPTRLAEAAAVVHDADKGVLLVVPDARDLARLESALAAVIGADSIAVLSAELGPAERYRRFLRVLHGHVRVVAGTRSAAFAPVARLGLIVVFADGDDALAEPRAPYPHARDVLLLRATQAEAGMLIGGYGRTAEAQHLVTAGWAHDVLPTRALVRSRSARIEAFSDVFRPDADSAAASARLGPAAFAAIRAALAANSPALVQVARRGYLGILLCFDCRRTLHCRHCHGALAQPSSASQPVCRWCGRVETAAVCQVCGCRRHRSAAPGDRRTAEELGRAFPGVPVFTSSGDRIRDDVPAGKGIVIATAGAEPAVRGELAGYGALVLLDSAAMLTRPDLRAAEEALRRWMTAAALVRPAANGGRVVLGVDTSTPAAQALIRWDAAFFANAELAARRELELPPTAVLAAIDGTPVELAEFVHDGIPGLSINATLLGPVPLNVALPGAKKHPTDEAAERLLVRVPLADRANLAAVLAELAAARSARKERRPLRVQIDPQAGI